MTDLRGAHRPAEHHDRRAPRPVDPHRGPRVRLDLDLGPLLLGRLQRLRVPRGRRLPRRPGLPHLPRAGRARSSTAPATGTRPCWPTPSPRSTTSPAGGPTSASAPAGRSTSTAPTASRSRRPASASTCSRSRSRPSAGCCARRSPTSPGKHVTAHRGPVRAEAACRPSCRSGSAAAARSARCASRPGTPTGGTCPSCRRRRSPTSATCSPTTARTVGRDPAEIRTAVNVGLCPDDDALRAQFGGLAEGVRPGVLMGSPDQLVDRIGEYVDGRRRPDQHRHAGPVAARPARPGDGGDRPAAHRLMVRAWAPGRVNLIGDHTDHTGGLVLPDGHRPRHHGHGRRRRRRRRRCAPPTRARAGRRAPRRRRPRRGRRPRGRATSPGRRRAAARRPASRAR